MSLPAPAPPRSRAVLAAGVAAALLAAALCAGLGWWQLERRAWKLALIEQIARGQAAPPRALPPPAQWAAFGPRVDAYARVRVSGHWLAGADTLVQASTVLGPGWWLMSPLRTEQGGTLLVNRGYVPSTWRTRPWPDGPAEPAGRPVTVTGLLREDEPGGAFLRANDPAAGRWTSRDVTAIARARGLPGPVAPFFIDADALPGVDAGSVGRQPVGGLTVTRLRNAHAAYAATWFALAALCVAAAGWLLREGRRGAGAAGVASSPAAPS